MADEDDVVRTVYHGGKIVATDDIELDMDIYTLTVKGNVDTDSESSGVTVEYVDEQDASLQAQIDALTARVDALENPA